MLKKKLLIACASLFMGGVTALVAPAHAAANPLEVAAPAATTPAPAAGRVLTHVGEIDGVPVVLQFGFQNGGIAGRLIIGTQTFPVVGTPDESGHGFHGKWRSGTNDYDFTATLDNGKLVLNTNGKSVPLTLAPDNGGGAPAPVAQAPAGIIGNPGVPQAPNDGQVQVVNGQFFMVPVPQGWTHKQRMGETVVISPDGKTAFGLVGRPTRATTPEEFALEFFRGYRVNDVKLVNPKPYDIGEGQKGLDALVTFTGADGVARTGAIKVMLMQGPQGSFGTMLHAATPKENEGNLKVAANLAMQIKVVNQRQQPASPGGAQAGLQF